MADEPAQTGANEKQLLLQKIYIKDLSFESPKAPQVFTTNAQAKTQLNVGSSNRQVDGDHVEVSLTLTIESKDNEETLFLIEIVQSGVFTIRGYTEQERAVLLGSFCPGTLFPFAREAVADIAAKGGFPQLLLQPINFDALYAEAVRARQAESSGSGAPGPIQVEGVETGGAGGAAAAGQPGNGDSQGGGDTH